MGAAPEGRRRGASHAQNPRAAQTPARSLLRAPLGGDGLRGMVGTRTGSLRPQASFRSPREGGSSSPHSTGLGRMASVAHRWASQEAARGPGLCGPRLHLWTFAIWQVTGIERQLNHQSLAYN